MNFRSRLFFFIVLAAPYMVAQTASLPSGWIKIPRPDLTLRYGNKVLSCANYADEWSLEVVNNRLQIQDARKRSKDEHQPHVEVPPKLVKSREMVGRMTSVRTADGWLLGFDGGEFGGGLWWSNETGDRVFELGTENVHFILRRGDSYLVVTGLAHMDTDEGQISIYQPGNVGRGTFTLLTKLKAAPSAMAVSRDGSVIIATMKGVEKLTLENQIETLYINPTFGQLYPESVVIDDAGAIWVGMRFYIMQLLSHPNLFDDTWFIPANCLGAKVEDYTCVCPAK